MATQIYGKIHFDDINGVPLSGGKVYVYEPGTTTDKASYTTPAASVANTQPVILDSRGESGIYVIGDCKIVVNDSLGNLIYTLDNVKDLYADVLALLAASSGSSLVGFIQSGTGAVARTIQSKERDTVSVFDFMTSAEIADVQAGTLTIDVTASVNSAFAMVGRRVFMPKGNYKITSNLNEPVCSAIVGAGRQNTLITAAAGVTNIFTIGTAAVNCQLFSDFSIYGNATSNATGILLGKTGQLSNLQQFTRIEIWNFTGTGSIGLDVRNAITHQFNNCYLCGNYVNLRVQGDTSLPTTLKFIGGAIRSATTKGAQITSVASLIFEGVIFENNTNEGCYVGGVVNSSQIQVVLRDCWFEGNYAGSTSNYQLVIDGAASGSVTNVQIDGGYFNGDSSTAKAIHITGAYAQYDLHNIKPPTSSVAGCIVIDNNAQGTYQFTADVNYLAFLSVTTPSGYGQDLNEGLGAWTSWTPVYSSDIGNAAATFTGTPTTTFAKYIKCGKTVTVSFNWIATLLAVTPYAFYFTLPVAGTVPGTSDALLGSSPNHLNSVLSSDGATVLIGFARCQGIGDPRLMMGKINLANYGSGNVVTFQGTLTFECI